MSGRRAGSVRFDPYYKIQWWEARSLAWVDVQRTHATELQAAEAAEAEPIGDRYRVMRITPDDRTPVVVVDLYS